MSIWLEALALFAPAGIANMTPPIANKIPYLNRWHAPMDFGRSLRGVRLFGANKTWRGLITATAAGTLFGALIHNGFFPDTDWGPYLLRCAVISAGALVGDAVESFFKRQRKLPPGTTWFPFDQIDYIIGGLVFMIPFGLPSLRVVLAILGIYFGLHLVITVVSYYLGFKDKPI
jgi:CDP-2,3-bis-(O-geranylgeranyl)-sn-glycerol synthase